MEAPPPKQAGKLCVIAKDVKENMYRMHEQLWSMLESTPDANHPHLQQDHLDYLQKPLLLPSSNGDPGSPLADHKQEQQGDDDDLDAEAKEDGKNHDKEEDEDGNLPEWEPGADWFNHLDYEDEDDLCKCIRELDQQDPIGTDSREDEYDKDFGLLNRGNDNPPAHEIP
ncbi:hypothetical protein FRC11_006735 [Ceratobasidium sp. 423]|nr:hypothetical protein FRC11_006735 [Ceratobasidium sp. 423]